MLRGCDGSRRPKAPEQGGLADATGSHDQATPWDRRHSRSDRLSHTQDCRSGEYILEWSPMLFLKTSAPMRSASHAALVL